MRGFTARPAHEKVAKWLLKIESALAHRALQVGAMSKLAGALCWGASALFKRMGRASLRP